MLPPPPEGLRHWRPEDAPALAAAWAEPSITAWNPPPPDLAPGDWIASAEDRWARRLALDLVIVAPDGGTGVAGEVGLSSFTHEPGRAELGVWLAAEHRGVGLATTAVRTVTVWALADLGVDQLWARTDPANAPAVALFERLGWDRLGTAGGKTIWSATAALLR